MSSTRKRPTKAAIRPTKAAEDGGAPAWQVVMQEHAARYGSRDDLEVRGPTGEALNRGTLIWQTGPVGVVGVNGLQVEDVLTACPHRLEAYQRYAPCQENVQAIALVTAARGALETRTLRRIRQAVEGTDRPHVSPDPTHE